MEIALYIILNALRYVQPIKLKQIEFVCYRKYLNFLFPRTTFIMIEFQSKKKKKFYAPLLNAVCITIGLKVKQITHFHSFADDLATMNCFPFYCLYITAYLNQFPLFNSLNSVCSVFAPLHKKTGDLCS